MCALSYGVAFAAIAYGQGGPVNSLIPEEANYIDEGPCFGNEGDPPLCPGGQGKVDCSDPPKDSPSQGVTAGMSLSDPVFLFNGEFYYDRVDLHVPGRGIDFVLQWRYRHLTGLDSRTGTVPTGCQASPECPSPAFACCQLQGGGAASEPLEHRTPGGFNWDHTYNIYLTEYPSSTAVMFHDGRGRSDVFRSTVADPFNTLPPEAHSEWSNDEYFGSIKLEGAPGAQEYLFEMHDGTVYTFWGPDATTPGYPGKLHFLTDRNGNEMTFNYDADGKLVTVTDTLGRDFSFEYDQTTDRLLSVSDYTWDATLNPPGPKRVVRYEYYGVGDSDGIAGSLKSVTLPDVPGEQAQTWTYTYYTSRLEGYHLNEIIDPNGAVLVKNTYDAQDRVIRQDYNDGADRYDYFYRKNGSARIYMPGDRPDDTFSTGDLVGRSTVIINRAGQVKERFYNSVNVLVAQVDYTGVVAEDSASEPALRRSEFDPEQHLPDFFEQGVPGPIDTELQGQQSRLGEVPYYLTQYIYDYPNANHGRESGRLREVWLPNGDRIVHSYEGDDVLDVVTTGREVLDAKRSNRVTTVRKPADSYDPEVQSEWIVNTWEYGHSYSGGCGCGSDFATAHIDGNGNRHEFSYNGAGDRTEIRRDVVGGVPASREVFTYTARGQLETHTHASNGVIERVDTYAYLEQGHPDWASKPGARGQLISVTVDSAAGGLGLLTQYDYDDLGNRSKQTDPEGRATNFEWNARGLLTAEISPQIALAAGPVRYRTDYDYDRKNNLIRTRTDLFDEEGNDGTATGTTETWIERDYDAVDRLVEVREQVGGTDAARQWVTTRYEYDPNDNLSRVLYGEAVNTNQPSNTVEYEYDERNLLLRTTRGAGSTAESVTYFEYDANGYRSLDIAGSGSAAEQVTAYFYDGHGRLESVVDPMGNETRFTYDGNHNLLKTEIWGETADQPRTNPVSPDPSNVLLAEEVSTFDGLDRLDTHTSRVFVVGVAGTSDSVGITSYNPDSSVATVTDARGNVTRFTYDRASRLAMIEDDHGNQSVLDYDLGSNVQKVTQRDDLDQIRTVGAPDSDFSVFIETFSYDPLNRLIQRTDGVGNTTTFEYDSRDNRVRAVDPRGNVVRHSFDLLNRPLGSTYEMTDDGTGSGSPDPINPSITMMQAWDDSSRIISRTDDNGNETRYLYDELDRLLATQFEDNTTEIVGRGVVFFDASAGQWVLNSYTPGYDVHGNMLVRQDQNKTVVRSSFDSANRLSRRAVNVDGTFGASVFGSNQERYVYDGLSRLIEVEDNDALVRRSYDSRSRVIAETSMVHSSHEAAVPEPLALPGIGQPVPAPTAWDGWADWETDPVTVSLTTSYQHDLVDNLTKITYASGRIVHYSYDKLNRISGVQSTLPTIPGVSPNPLELQNEIDFIYSGPDRLKHRHLGNGIVGTITYSGINDGAGGTTNPAGDFGFHRPNRITYQLGPTVLSDFEFQWDPSQNRDFRREHATTPIIAPHRAMEYDSVGRITKVSNVSLYNDTRFSMDGVHNRTWTSARPGTQSGYYTMDPPGAGFEGDAPVNQYTETPWNLLAYDRNGNLTTWDATAASGTSSAMASGGDPTLFQGVAQSASTDTSGDPMDFDNSGFVDDTDGAMLLDMAVSGGPQALAPPSAGAQTQSMMWCEELPCEDPPDPCSETPHYVRVANARYDYRNLMTEYVSYDDACPETVGEVTRYLYDPLGRRVGKVLAFGDPVNEIELYFANGGRALWQVLEEWTQIGTIPVHQASYVFGDYVDEVVSMRRNVDTSDQLPEDYCYLIDDLHNPLALTDGTGSVVERYDYDVYGTPFIFDASGASLALGSAFGNPYLFTGRRFDLESSLYYYRTRYYEPTIGRFTTHDSIGIWGDPAQMGNGTNYVACSPWGFTDPFGQLVWPLNGVKEISRRTHQWHCLRWARKELSKPTDWLKELPACPCSIDPEDPFGNGGCDSGIDSDTWEPPATHELLERYHPGGSWELRSKPSSSNAGQQCIYDDAGNLLPADSPGAGTSDRVTPSHSKRKHFFEDVVPYEDCKAAELEDIYFNLRPRNGGKPCS